MMPQWAAKLKMGLAGRLPIYRVYEMADGAAKLHPTSNDS